MLKITILRDSTTPMLKLEGKLSGPWVRELERIWGEIRHTELQPATIVELSEVTFISSEGKELLKSMDRQGAELQSHSLMTRFIVNQIKGDLGGKLPAGDGGGNGNDK